MATWDDVRALALALPETEEAPYYGRTGFKVRGRTFAWESPHEAGALCLWVDPDERPLLLEAQPGAFWITRHYERVPIVLVRLDAIALDELRDRLADSWLAKAPAALAKRLDG